MRWLLVACSIGCTGFERTPGPPRPRLISPLSTSFVAGPSPPLRFALPPSAARPALDLCRTRSCDGPLLHGTADAASGTATPDQALDPGLWYWRIRADTTMGPSVSSTWQFRIVPQPA